MEAAKTKADPSSSSSEIEERNEVTADILQENVSTANTFIFVHHNELLITCFNEKQILGFHEFLNKLCLFVI